MKRLFEVKSEDTSIRVSLGAGLVQGETEKIVNIIHFKMRCGIRRILILPNDYRDYTQRPFMFVIFELE